MTELSRTILETWQVRKTKQQKSDFIAFLQTEFPELQVEKGKFGVRNLVLGSVADAKVVLGAHYDTCARLPFPNFLTPKNFLCYLGYQLLILIPFFAVAFLLSFFLTLAGVPGEVTYWLVLAAYFGLLALMMAGPANRHTVNDNTSGVITLLECYAAMSEEERRETAFVFFDLEESGLIGSAQFAKRHKAEMKGKLLLNFDCVSDGDHFLVIANKKARAAHEDALRAAFSKAPEGKTVSFEKAATTIYPSDQANFPVSVAISAFKRHPVFGLYMDRIHTKRDTELDERNIRWLVESTRKLVQ